MQKPIYFSFCHDFWGVKNQTKFPFIKHIQKLLSLLLCHILLQIVLSQMKQRSSYVKSMKKLVSFSGVGGGGLIVEIKLVVRISTCRKIRSDKKKKEA